MDRILHKKIRIVGNKKNVEKAEQALTKLNLSIKQELEEHPRRWRIQSEAVDRLLIQKAIDEHNLKADILYDGNGVWSLERILKNMRRIIKHGTLYDCQRPRYIPIGSMLRVPEGGKPILSEYFYEFLHLNCGTIAHYNIQGWIAHYPTVDDLKRLFKKNEYGKPVLEDVPGWKTDVKRIVEHIYMLLFPFESYLKFERRSFTS